MKVLYDWFIEACSKPKIQQTPGDEMIMILFPAIIVSIIVAIILIVCWICEKVKK